MRDAVLQKIEQDEAEQRKQSADKAGQDNKDGEKDQVDDETSQQDNKAQDGEEEAAKKKKDEEDAAATKKKSEEEESAAAAAAAAAPAVEDTAPRAKEADGESKQAVEESTPAAEESKPAAEESKPAAEESKPGAEESKPAAEESKPAAEESKPAAEESKPAAEPEAPADDEIDYDAIEREMAEMEAKEAAAEAEYQRRKDVEKEEKARKAKEEEDAYIANMKNAEREAEALEAARISKKQQDTAAAEEDTGKKEAFASLKKGGGFPATETASAESHPPTSTILPAAKQVEAGNGAKPTGLKLETSAIKSAEPPQPSAAMKSLHNARFVEDLTKVSYPPSISPPNPVLNENAPADHKFHYNKEFLLQFQNIVKEKPSVDWETRVKETIGDGEPVSSRPSSARAPAMGSRTTSRSSMPQPFNMGNMGHMGTMGGMGNMGSMGMFGQAPRHGLPPGTTSEQRFAMSNAVRTASMGATNPFNFGPRGGGFGMTTPVAMTRTNSANAMGVVPGPGGRVPSGSRTGTGTGSKRGKKKEEEVNKAMPLTAGQEFKALTTSASGWKPRSVGHGTTAGPMPGGGEHMPPDVVQRKVKAALNKMTPENFDRISSQILDIVSQSKDETDGRTLRQVIQLTFEKATDEAHWAPMYARFCKVMLESMSPEIKDEGIHDKNGNVVAGGSLFRKYLLNRCQEEFERGWKVNLPPRPEGEDEEAAMMSDEYYAAAAAKRRGLGLVKFIGELYKLGMLTERIMHECVKKLVDYEGVPDEAEVESLTSLLRTIGASLDASERGHSLMDIYFARINMMIQSPDLHSRTRFMLMVCLPRS